MPKRFRKIKFIEIYYLKKRKSGEETFMGIWLHHRNESLIVSVKVSLKPNIILDDRYLKVYPILRL